MMGLALSVLIHLSLVGSYYIAGIHQQGIIVPPLPPGGFTPLGNTEFIPGFAPLAPLHPSHVTLPVGKGTPIPVENTSIDVTYASQREFASGVEGVGGGAGEGGSGEVTIPPEEEPEPPPFRPVQIEPRVIQSVAPEYPPLAVQTGLEGKVWIKIWVDESGRPRKAVVVKGDVEVFNEAAMAAAMKFVFTPAIMNDRPVSVWVAIPFSFRLH
jgi:protein TonB